MSLDSSLNENITVIKDLFTIVFTGVATIIGFLTYRRARATVLQPIRTEVVKKQSTMLSELLAVISQEEIFAFDYIETVSMNVYSILLKYGFIFSKQEELEKLLHSKICASIPCGEDTILKNVKLLQPFESEQERETDEKERKELRRKEYDQAKKEGIIIVDSIVITNKHNAFCKKLSDFSANPFMPSSIQESLNDLLHTVHVNLVTHLKQTLKEFIGEYFKRHASGDKANFSVDGVWNKFNHKRFHHREQFDEIKKAIREHLRIDERW